MIKYKIVSDTIFTCIYRWNIYELDVIKNTGDDVLYFLIVNEKGEQFLLSVEYININEIEDFFFKFQIKKYNKQIDEEEAEYVSRELFNYIEKVAKKIVPKIDLIDYYYYFPNHKLI